jgi:UDP-glucose 4-epimerase
VFGNDVGTPDGTCVRDFIHVSDLASAHLKALLHLAEGGSSLAVNLATGKGTSIAELMRTIEEVSGRKVPHVFAPPRAGDPPSLYADPGKAKEILGWEAQFDVRQIIEGAWKWEERLPDFLGTP